MATTYGTGTPTQFTDGSARQVLELGKKVHMYNPDMTPMYTMLGRLNTLVTPVPIFEWMEDEWFVKPSVVVPVAACQIIDQTTGTVNDHGSIIQMNKQSDIEAFEKGAVYKLTLTTTTAGSSAIHAMCTAIGKDCGTNGSESDLNVQFILGDYTDDTTFRHQLVAMGTAMFATAGTIQFDYVGDNFSSEARSIHYGNKKFKNGIYGKASSKDIKELRDEGIETTVIPWVNDNEN